MLLSADGLENREVARRLGSTAHVVGRWRAQFLLAGVKPARANELCPCHPRFGPDYLLGISMANSEVESRRPGEVQGQASVALLLTVVTASGLVSLPQLPRLD
jgi:hypothetical protein